MSVTVEDFLEHHGVKGQHWGIRNHVRDLRDKIHKNKKLKVGLEIGAGVAVTATIAAGAIFADRAIRKHALMKATDLRTLWNKGTYPVPNFPPTVMKTPISNLPKLTRPTSGSRTKVSYKGLKAIETRFNKTLKPGSTVTTKDVNSAVANIGKATYQTAKTTKRKDLLKALGSVRISVG
jgi:hypothetical protein